MADVRRGSNKVSESSQESIELLSNSRRSAHDALSEVQSRPGVLVGSKILAASGLRGKLRRTVAHSTRTTQQMDVVNKPLVSVINKLWTHSVNKLWMRLVIKLWV